VLFTPGKNMTNSHTDHSVYLPMDYFPKLSAMRADRIMFGTDFPNLPYAWDREIKRLAGLNLPGNTLARILGGNASEFYSINAAGLIG